MVRDTSEHGGEHTNSAPAPTRGPQLSDLYLPADPGAWSTIGFAVTASGCVPVGRTTLLADGYDSGRTGWSFDAVAALPDLDGIPVIDMVQHEDRSAPRDQPIHPNGIVSIDHVVVATPDCRRTTTAFTTAGFPIRRTINTERFGSPMQQSFLWAGDVIIEVIGPVSTDAHAGEPKAGKASLFGLTFTTTDMDLTVSVMGDLIGDPGPALQPDRSIATVRTRGTGLGTRIAVMTPHIGRRP